MGPQHAPFQVHADSARQAPQGDSEFRRGHPSFSRAAGRDPTRAGIGLKAVPDSFHRKRNSANPPPVTTRPSRGGPRCTAFPRGPTTRTRRSSVIRRRAASLVMARVATQPSTRTRHTSCTGPNDVSGDSDTLHRATAQLKANCAPKARNRARVGRLPPVDQTRPISPNSAHQGASGPESQTSPTRTRSAPMLQSKATRFRIFHETT